jgi:hypothetical protein
MALPVLRWPCRISRLTQRQRPPLGRIAASSSPAQKLPIRLNIVDPETDKAEQLEFRSSNALRDWINGHHKGGLALVRPGQPRLILDQAEYDSLDPTALYSFKSTVYTQAALATKHNGVFDRAWEIRCRRRIMDWFEEETIYVVEGDRVLYEQGSVVPAAEWEGAWRGVDGTVYLLESKYNMTCVYFALLHRR